MLQAFWSWYERNYVLNVSIALGLFLLQIVHLVWLGGEVVVPRALGVTLFDVTGIFQTLIIIVDYTEIPAIITMSIVYIDVWRRGQPIHAFLMLALLNIQWLHLFWITDEFVVETFSVEHIHSTVLPVWLAWVAILIDYLEVPVIIDTVLRLLRALRERAGVETVRAVLNEKV